jgi:hypothetical protein
LLELGVLTHLFMGQEKMLYAPAQFRNLKGRQHHQVSMDIIAENDLFETVSRFSEPSL